MIKRKVVSRKNLPTRLPLTLTIAVGLLLDRFDAAGVVWGVVGTLVAYIWIVALLGMFAEDDVEVLK